MSKTIDTKQGNFTSKVEVKVDGTAKTVHVLDVYGPTSLTNLLDETLENVKNELQAEGVNLEGYEWVLYHRDATILDENSETADESKIDVEFEKKMLELRK